MSWQVLEADCVEAMREMEDNSVDAVVTDPPAGISFMGRAWDSDRSGGFVEWLAGVMREALRVTKPGGHALVWALPRTSHWTGSAIEGAGWEIRDRIAHHFGSGFPKSHNLGNGYGTGLKPATEDWWLARKPLVGTVAQNVERFGTGALAIDACRIGTDPGYSYPNGPGGCQSSEFHYQGRANTPAESNPAGRWPANVVLSHLPDTDEDPGCQEDLCGAGCPVAELDRQSGELQRNPAARYINESADNQVFGEGMGKRRAEEVRPGYGDTGGASRFFYCAKSSRSERNAGLEGFEERRKKVAVIQTPGVANDGDWEDGKQLSSAQRNHHPTVKPVELMRWLVRLVTPPGGTVLDPFAGSGTTGIACVLEDFDFIGIERESEYVEIAKARIAWWDTHKDRADEILALSARSERERQEHEAQGQESLFG